MKKIYFIIYKHEIDLFCRLKLDDECLAYYFDPALTDDIESKNLSNIFYLSKNNDFSASTMQENSRRSAIELEQKICKTISKFTCVKDVVGWQYLTLKYFFLNYFWYYELWAEILPLIPDGQIVIFINNNPHNLNQQSFLPSILLMQSLSSIGREYKGYLYGEFDYELSKVLDFKEKEVLNFECDLLVHLPTIIHDSNFINSQLSGLGSIVNIESKYWNIKINNSAMNIGFVEQCDSLDFYDQKQLKVELQNDIESILSRCLADHDFRRQQINFLTESLITQLNNYYLIEHFFSIHLPKKILISDHDVGLHGPILFFCEKNEIEVYVFPHGKFILDTGFNINKVNYLNHPIQKNITSIRTGVKRKSNLYFPASCVKAKDIQETKKLSVIGLLLNAISIDGVLTSNTEEYLNGIKDICNWCRRNSISIHIRNRPDKPIIKLLEETLKLDDDVKICNRGELLIDFIADVDLCIMYDSPTSASVNVLDAKCPIIHILPAGMDYWTAGWIDEMVIPFYNITDGVHRLDELNKGLDYFLKQQQEEYSWRMQNSKTLSYFLTSSVF